MNRKRAGSLGTDRLERVLRLMGALQLDRPCTICELTELLNVSRRTVYRDLDLLARVGIAFTRDAATGRFALNASTLLPPVNLTHAEALTVMLGTRHMVDGVAPDPAVALSAGMKLSSALPAALQDYCGTLLERIEHRRSGFSDVRTIATPFRTLQAALLKAVKIETRYDSYHEQSVIDVTLQPYRLLYMHRGWYLIAFCERHGEVRTFKVERFLQIKMLHARCSVPRTFNLDDYFGNAWHMLKGDRRYHVRIRFAKMVAANVDEIMWHKTQATTFLEDGSLIFEVDVDGVEEIAWWVLGYGDQAEVLDPPELREIIGGHVKRMSACYGVSVAKRGGGSTGKRSKSAKRRASSK